MGHACAVGREEVDAVHARSQGGSVEFIRHDLAGFHRKGVEIAGSLTSRDEEPEDARRVVAEVAGNFQHIASRLRSGLQGVVGGAGGKEERPARHADLIVRTADREKTHSVHQRHGRGHYAAGGVEHRKRIGQGTSASVGQFEGYALRKPCRALPAFGEKVQADVLPVFRHQGAAVAQGEVRLRGHFQRGQGGVLLHGPCLIHGHHAGEVASVPVEHLAGVGPHLVVAALHGQGQREGACCLTEGIHGAQQPVERLARSVEQIDVEHAAQPRGLAVAARHIGLEPQRLARGVGRVVEVQIYFLARVLPAEARGILHAGVQLRHLVLRHAAKR